MNNPNRVLPKRLSSLLNAAILSASVLIVPPSISNGQNQTEAVKLAIKNSVQTDDEFQTVHKYLMGDDDRDLYLKVNWQPDLHTAMKVANQSKRPMFIWATDGEPLGCT